LFFRATNAHKTFGSHQTLSLKGKNGMHKKLFKSKGKSAKGLLLITFSQNQLKIIKILRTN